MSEGMEQFFVMIKSYNPRVLRPWLDEDGTMPLFNTIEEAHKWGQFTYEGNKYGYKIFSTLQSLD